MAQRTIRASELASFTYCARAWWYRLQGEVPSNLNMIEDGIRWHVKLENRNRRALWLRNTGIFFIASALLLAAILYGRILFP